MKKTPLSLRKLLIAAGFVGIMGFGALQAVAGSSADKAQSRTCSPVCEPDCQGFGGTYRAGVCWCCG